MKYVLTLAYIVVFHLTAIALSVITDTEYESILGALAIGGLSMLAAEFYTTKEGR